MRRTARLLTIALFAFAGAACRGGTDWRIVNLFGGESSIDVLRAPQAVEAFRISPEPAKRGAPGATVAGYPVLEGPVAVDAASVAELSSVFLDPNTYEFASAKGCEFMPGVAFRMVKDATRLELALCFSCDEFHIWRRDATIGGEDFDSARPRLLAVAKRLFPGDAKIQALK